MTVLQTGSRLCLSPSGLRLGFGCSGVWGQPWFAETKAAGIVRAAIDQGVSHFDTAGFYAEAEARLGRIIASAPADQLFVSTKTGTRRDGRGRLIKDFSKAAIIDDVETSLRRLGRERLDLVYLHGPDRANMFAALEVLVDLKEAGKVAYTGYCGEGALLGEAASTDGIDVVMGAYNVFRREHQAYFADARAAGKAVVAIAPLAQGLYRRGFFTPRGIADLWYLARALIKNRRDIERVRMASDLLAAPGLTPTEVALGFVLGQPEIDLALTTTTKLAHLDETVAAARKVLPVDVKKRLDSFEPGS